MDIFGFMLEDIDEFIIYLSTLESVELDGDYIRITPFVKSDEFIKIRTNFRTYNILQHDWISWLRNYKIDLLNDK